jgi:hypothetical protein
MVGSFILLARQGVVASAGNDLRSRAPTRISGVALGSAAGRCSGDGPGGARSARLDDGRGGAVYARLAQCDHSSSDGTCKVSVVQRAERSDGFTTQHQLADRFLHCDKIAQRSWSPHALLARSSPRRALGSAAGRCSDEGRSWARCARLDQRRGTRSARLAQRDHSSSDGVFEIPVVQRSERSNGFTTDHQLADSFLHLWER